MEAAGSPKTLIDTSSVTEHKNIEFCRLENLKSQISYTISVVKYARQRNAHFSSNFKTTDAMLERNA